MRAFLKFFPLTFFWLIKEKVILLSASKNNSTRFNRCTILELFISKRHVPCKEFKNVHNSLWFIDTSQIFVHSTDSSNNRHNQHSMADIFICLDLNLLLLIKWHYYIIILLKREDTKN